MIKRKSFVILGAGGHAKDLFSIYKAMVHDEKVPCDIKFLGYLDDTEDRFSVEKPCFGSIVDGYMRLMSEYGGELRYVIGVNDPVVRAEIAERMDRIYARPVSLVHPTASIGINITLGKGVVMGPYTVLTNDVQIGDHTHMNTGSSVNQGSAIGNFCTLSPGVRVCGDVKVGDLTSMGANSTIINMKNVGSRVILGAGAVVVNDIPDNCTAVGVPAKVIKND